MSHFTVLVKVTPEKLAEYGNVQDAVDAMLAPYHENNMGNCPKQYLEFYDKTDEIMADADKIIEPDSHMAERHPDLVGKTYLDAYEGDLDSFIEAYHGYKKDPETGKYGYWENPNKKWDWYQIGGRWTGLLRLKESVQPVFGKKSWMLEDEPYQPHTGDICKVKDFDLEGVILDAGAEAKDFWEDYLRDRDFIDRKKRGEQFKDEEKRDLFHNSFNVHDRMISCGLRKLVKQCEPMVDENGEPIMEDVPMFPGDRGYEKGKTVKRQKWTEPKFEDVPFALEDLLTKYRWTFEWGTFAVLDNEGWHSKGEMGWWGISTDTPDDNHQWKLSFLDRFIACENPETLLTIVDCHI